MSDWYLTWQDGAAWLVALGGLGLSFWLRRVLGRGGACSRCQETNGAAPVVPAARLLRKVRG